jgi:hypothetical protein
MASLMVIAKNAFNEFLDRMGSCWRELIGQDRAPQMVPLRSVSGIEEYRIIQLVDGHLLWQPPFFR